MSATMSPAMSAALSLPTLQLDLRLDGTDTFGTLEWVLASARRTGLSLQQMHMQGRTARLVTEAPEAGLLQLFLRRVEQGVDLAVLEAEFTEQEDIEAADTAEALAA
ncbi:hypothetical protein C7418_2386 [Cupriavidus plantarum]|uniref:AsnC family transcriptional regulator n=1 Tax=Cupriavidus plantarum TaxID=942865 RepID=A0A316EW64_9BURK|nr:AsnC family transcriptional regulator [Cupriavidus plantarum]PWK35173.1 hypothetical protein C7419_102449 [Cupriavidus plantarum]REE93618.1 hypothetical protein C7418_2386 [Cupriavidus plantarum]